MTESDWLTSTDPAAMLMFVRSCGASDRKLRLAGCACARRVLPLLRDPRLDALVTAAERVADGHDANSGAAVLLAVTQSVTTSESPTAHNGKLGVVAVANLPTREGGADLGYGRLANTAAWMRVPGATAGPGRWQATHDLNWLAEWVRERAAQTDVLRDAFRNPTRRSPFRSGWRTEAVVSLAQGIYEERAWDRMSVLGDALEEAGCDDPEVLQHCRGPNEHQRGCWVVDLALNRG